MQFALTGVFTALDGFLFYVFWELALLPIWFICLVWGGPESARITLRFFLYTLAGSLLMLVALLLLYRETPAPHSFAWDALRSVRPDAPMQSLVFWLFLAAFAVKIPLFPLHSWQPDTYTDAPTAGTMLLSGIMLKMGLYGLLRWLLPVVPGAVAAWGWLVMLLAVAGVVYASCLALVQTDFKRLIAYSSLAHVGLIAAGIFSLTPEGLQGSLVQMVAHGVNAVGLFFVADILAVRMQTRRLDRLGGLAAANRPFAVLFMIVLLGSIALPLTNGFAGEFLLLNGIYRYGPWTALFAGLTVILGAVYMLRSYQAIMLGPLRDSLPAFGALRTSESAVLAVVAALVIAAGVYPGFLTTISEAAVLDLLRMTR
jgi:NADH-quinone oxidoreductase subunit M